MPTKPATGRTPGFILAADAFEALARAHRYTKGEAAKAARIEPSTLSDLLARRRGASRTVATRIADVFAVPPAALFPELAGWTPPTTRRRRNHAPVEAA